MNMKKLWLKPEQIISSGYQKLHDIEMLQAYFLMFSSGLSQKVPPVPVMHRDLIAPYFPVDLKSDFERFRSTVPAAEYFLLDGSHRTTAAMLSGVECPALVISSVEDIAEMKALVSQGVMFKYDLGDDLLEVREQVIGHFRDIPNFQTTFQKTLKMIQDRTLPEYMIRAFGQTYAL
jgi:hypothetical protein